MTPIINGTSVSGPFPQQEAQRTLRKRRLKEQEIRRMGWQFGEMLIMDTMVTLLINTQKLWLPVLDKVNHYFSIS